MKSIIAGLIVFASLSAFANRTVIQCKDGPRSMTITKTSEGKLRGHFVGFSNDEMKQMSCNKIKRTSNYRCDKGDYYVVVFYGTNQKLNVQLNLKGDFGNDSGYLYSLSCK
jgi:hypothetical protein